MDAYPAREWKTVIQGSFKSAKLKQILKEACELLAERSKIDVVAACITPDFWIDQLKSRKWMKMGTYLRPIVTIW